MAASALHTVRLMAQTGIKAVPGSLLDALHRRRTDRTFAARDLSQRHLSQLFWAAYGVNRSDGKRTAPAAMGIYSLSLYAVTREGIYLYHPATGELVEILRGDYRGFSGTQDFVATAPLNIVIYADYRAFRTGDPKTDAIIEGHEDRMAALDAGAVAENIYLYCASEGINVVERMMLDDRRFGLLAGLPDSARFQVAMTVGYPE